MSTSKQKKIDNPSGKSKQASSGASKKKSSGQSLHDSLVELYTDLDLSEMFSLCFMMIMLFVFPLIGVQPFYENIISNKILFLFTIIPVMSIIILITSAVKCIVFRSYRNWFQRGTKENLPSRLRSFGHSFSAVDISLAMLCVFVLISFVFCEDKQLAWEGVPERNNGLPILACYAAIYFLIARFLKMRQFALSMLYFGGTLVAVVLILHTLGIDLLNIQYIDVNYMGPIGNIDFTSYWLSITLIVAASVYITEQFLSFDKHGFITLICFALLIYSEWHIDVDSGLVAIAAAIMVALPLLLTNFRRVGRFLTVMAVGTGAALLNNFLAELHWGKKCWVLLAATLLFAVLALAINTGKLNCSPSRKKLLKLTLGIDGGIIAAVLIVAWIASSRPSMGIIYELGQMLYHFNFDDHFGTLRLFLWKSTLKLIAEHPLIGSGPESFTLRFYNAFSKQVELYFGPNMLARDAHNEFLHLWFCSGITALCAYVSFLGLMVVNGFRRADKDPLLACCTMGVIGYAAHAFFGIALPLHTPMVWILFGITGAVMRGSSDDKPAETAAETQTDDTETIDADDFDNFDDFEDDDEPVAVGTVNQ